VTQPSSDFVLVDEEPGMFVFATYANVNMFIWSGFATGAITDRLEQHVARQVPMNPYGLSTVHVMTDTAGPPTPEARRGFAETGRRWEKSIIAVSLVIEREGFWGSALRSAVTGIQMLLRRADYPIHVHASIAETAAWLPSKHLARSGVKLDPSELLRALQGARSYAKHRASIAPPHLAESA
jgi:hypothetical protein